MSAPKLIELDGRTGEGGGQLVRIAVALASVLSQPIRITNVRGNRPGARGGGLKAQHVSSIEWLVQATDAAVTGLAVGSQTLEFRPRRKPAAVVMDGRHIRIEAQSAAASTMLILQAVLPFLLFAGNAKGEPLELELLGGTNVSFSLSFEYLDQVFLPTLEDRFGILVRRRCKCRGWSLGPTSRGTVVLGFEPLAPGTPLRTKNPDRTYTAADFVIENIDVTMVVPASMHEALTRALARDLEVLFPDTAVEFKSVEDSGLDVRAYILLVGRSRSLRWGRDFLGSVPKKTTSRTEVCDRWAQDVAKRLYEDVERGTVDEFMQDQLIIFQALAEGRTSSFRSEDGRSDLQSDMARLDIRDGSQGLKRVKKTHEPFGQGSMHTTTARWVATELLPQVVWYNDGSVCDGAAIRMEAPVAQN